MSSDASAPAEPMTTWSGEAGTIGMGGITCSCWSILDPFMICNFRQAKRADVSTRHGLSVMKGMHENSSSSSCLDSIDTFGEIRVLMDMELESFIAEEQGKLYLN